MIEFKDNKYAVDTRRHAVLAVALVTCVGWSLGHAYELATHGAMTYEAFKRSMLNPNQNDSADSQFLKKILGIRNGANPLGSVYFDVSGETVRERTWYLYEQDGNRMPGGTEPLSVEGWIMRGAIREDDVLDPGNGQPVDDPYNSGNAIFDNRVLHHFFDPFRNSGLTRLIPPGWLGIHKAPDWAIGSTDAFQSINTPEADRRNHFAIFDAREAMYRAVTGKRKDGTDAGRSSAKATEEDRKTYWATTFRALGDVVHLVQDMGQPQHTRNDPHGGRSPEWIFGHASIFEYYTDVRAVGGSLLTPRGSVLKPRALDYGSYAIPRFANYASYFSTRNIHSDIHSRQGLADYSNRGFFSAGTNIGNLDYPYPVPAAGRYGRQDVTANCLGDPLGGTTQLLTGDVPDSLGSPASNQPLSAHGLWDEFLEQRNRLPSYSLNCFNYDAMADLLIPRTVAYSAGILDFFFRGRLDISLPDEGVYGIVDHAVTNRADQGFTKIKLKLRNTTPAIYEPGGAMHPQDMASGHLIAVAKYYRNGCYQPNLAGELLSDGVTPSGCDFLASRTKSEEISVSRPIVDVILASSPADPASAPAVTFMFDFSDQPIPINATDLYIQIVYRGKLGSEDDAVVVATRDVSEPTFISYLNSTDYFWIDDSFYTPEEIAQNPVLIAKVRGKCTLTLNYEADPVSVKYRFGDRILTSVDLPPRRYSRVAVLVDNAPFGIRVEYPDPLDSTVCYAPLTSDQEMQSALVQMDPETDNLNFHWIGSTRGIWGYNRVLYFKAKATNTGREPGPADLTVLDSYTLTDPGPYPMSITF